MQTRRLGTTGPEISVVGYGAWEAGGDAWGPNESPDGVIRAIRTALEAGMTWVDTAEVYGRGTSEELAGRAVAGRRDDVLLFTKVAPEPEGTGFRPDQVRRAIQGSLGRLGTDRVDLYQLHWPDPGVPVEETWGAMGELQDEGLALHIGLSNVGADLLRRCEAVRHVESVQNELSLLVRDDRNEFLAAVQDVGAGYLAYSPLGLGLLTGAISADTQYHPQDFRGGTRGEVPEPFRPENLAGNLERVEKLRSVAERVGTRPAVVALRWVVQQPGVTAAIAGSRNPDHVRSNADAGSVVLDEATLAEVDAIFGETSGAEGAR